MEFHDTKRRILEDIERTLNAVDRAEVERLIDEIKGAEKVFVVGAGRAFLVMQAFAKRLNHLGVSAHVVGAITQPSASGRDLIIAGSASGESVFPADIGRLGKKLGARVALLTSAPESTLSKCADTIVRIPAATKTHRPDEPTSIQPMNNLFEQSLYILCDTVTMMMQEQSGLSAEELWERHANLE